METGLFTGRTYGGLPKALEANTPPGCGAIEGRWSQDCHRVDLDSGAIVDYRPPPPDDLHIWDYARRRYVLKPEERQRRRLHRAAVARIRELELRQARPLRELTIDPDNREARRRVNDIDQEIEAMRADVMEELPDADL